MCKAVVYSKYKRGDVWFIKLNTEDGDGVNGSSVQKKSRPCVIVSCEQNNNNAPTFNVVPIETKEYDHLPCHVYYRYGGRDQVVLCEQIKTISELDFKRNGSRYMYGFSVEFMNKIDQALAAQLGLTPRIGDIKIFENMINRIVDSREDELKKKYEESLRIRAEELAVMISKRFGIILTPDDVLNGSVYDNPDLEYAPKEIVDNMKKTAEERMTRPIDNPEPDISTANIIGSQIVSRKSNPIQIVNSGLEISSKSPKTIKKETRRKNTKWNNDLMKQFINDADSMSLSEVSKKWGVSKKSIHSMKSSFKKKLEVVKEE